MFTITFDREYDIVSLSFRNELIEFYFDPEDATALLKDGFDSAPSNGDFSFSFSEETISFSIAKHGDGQGGRFSLSLKMTKEIKESLDNAMSEWREYVEERNEA